VIGALAESPRQVAERFAIMKTHQSSNQCRSVRSYNPIEKHLSKATSIRITTFQQPFDTERRNIGGLISLILHVENAYSSRRVAYPDFLFSESRGRIHIQGQSRSNIISAMWIVLVSPNHQDPGIAGRHAPPRKPSTVSGKDYLCHTLDSKPRQSQ
jgi:hypothetical protein